MSCGCAEILKRALVPRRVKDLGANGNPGDAARSAAAEWRYAAAKLLLELLQEITSNDGGIKHQTWRYTGILYNNHIIWLVVWNMNVIFPNSWDDDPI